MTKNKVHDVIKILQLHSSLVLFEKLGTALTASGFR